MPNSLFANKKVLNESEKWLSLEENSKLKNRTQQYPYLEESLFLWLKKAKNDNLVVTDEILIEKAKLIGDQLKISSEFKYSKGWLQRFKEKFNLKKRTLHGEAGSVDINSFDAQKIQLKNNLLSYRLSDIYNIDETALFYTSPSQMPQYVL